MGTAARVKMYSTPTCWYCASARRLLAAKGIDFEDINISKKAELRQEMEKLSGGQTVPQIFINESAVGGYDDIAALEQTGELDKLLATEPNGENTSE